MDPGSGTNARQSQAQTPRGVTVGTLKRGPTLQLAARGLCSWAAPLRLRQHGHGTNANAARVTPAC
eukprot:scaffold40300_cov270-Isochrysis_galbana.AAC.1